jgi:peptide/nickel transport system substrate-binding protein
MRMTLRSAPAALAAGLAALALGACGGDGDGAGGGGDKAADGAGGAIKKGGTVKLAHSSFPDYLDPSLSYTVDGWQVLHLVYPGLLTYRAESGPKGAEVVPALAEDLPEVSEDGKTYTLKMREGVTFSNGDPVRASDFKASIERILEQDSQGSGLGYTNIVGAEDFLETKKGGIDGIEADDETGEILINLVQPRGAFVYELAIPFAGVVPADTPARNMTKEPPPGAGRYMFEDVSINRGYTLVKNPKFSEAALKDTPVAAGNVDRIEASIVEEGASTNQVAQGQLDFQVDNPVPDRVAEIKQKYPDRFHQFPTPSSFYFFMNSEVPPFDDVKVRQAVNHAIDPDAINRVQGGVIAPAHTTIPPGVPGHVDSEDLYPYDLETAKQLIKEAGATGEEVTVWGNTENPTKPTMEYYADVLNSIGLKAKVRILPGSTYFATIGDRSIEPQTGWANWFQDYPHPSNFIDVLLNPNRVRSTGNNNYSYNADDKELATEIEALSAETELTDDVVKRWAELDRKIQEKAYWAIYGNRKQTTFFSERMNFEQCKGEHPAYTHNWAQFCLK